MKNFWLSALGSVLLFPATAQPSTARLQHRVDSAVETAIQANLIPGAVVQIQW